MPLRPPLAFFHALRMITRLLRKLITYPKFAIHVLRRFVSRYQTSTRNKLITTTKPESCTVSFSEDLSLTELECGLSRVLSTSTPSDVPYAPINTTSASALQGDPPAPNSHPEDKANEVKNECPLILPNGWKLEPVTASEVMQQRYERIHSAKNPPKPLEIDAMRTNFQDDNKSGWTDCVHPEGARYFYRKKGLAEFGTVCTIFTNADVRDAGKLDICEILDHAIDRLFDWTEDNGGESQIRANVDLVLHPGIKRKIVGYYFVDLDSRCLVWREKLTKVARITESIRGVSSMGHIKHAMEAQYWYHVEAFPHSRSLQPIMYRELSNAVLHASADRLTSRTSLSPYDSDELEKMRGILESLEGQVGMESPYAVCIVARFSSAFARSRLYNFCGQPEARLDADKSVWPCQLYAQNWAFICISFVMFGTSHLQLERLSAIWVDRAVNKARWKEYITTVCDEFMGLTLYSTVMLAVDVSFLAVPSVEGTGLGNENAATVSTYISIIAVTGSMTLSLLLSMDARQRQSQSASEAVALLATVSKSLLGLETLAVMYSLPFALLMWGMLFFLVGLCSRIFPHAATYTIGSCAVALLILAIVVCLPLYTWWRAKKTERR